jgi:membrane protein required for colicin V production
VNWIDLILLLVAFLFGVRGYYKGLFRETFSLAGLVAGFMIGVRHDEAVASWAGLYSNTSPFILMGAAFVAIFLLVYFIFALAGWLLHRAAKVLFLKTINHLGGVAVGLGKGTAVIALILLFLTSSAWIPRATRDRVAGSYFAAPLTQLATTLIRIGKENLLPKERGGALTRQRFCCS